MVDNFPPASLVETITAAPTGHLSLHKAERQAYNALKDAVSAYGLAPMDLFAVGGSDTDKLEAAIAYCGNLVKSDGTGTAGVPTIQMGLRQYEITRSQGKPYNGFQWQGCAAGQVHQKSTSTDSLKTRVKVTIAPSGSDSYGYLFNIASGTAWNHRIGGFNGYSDRSDCVVYRAPYVQGVSTGYREGSFFDQTWQNVRVFGSPSEAVALTIHDIVGGWGIFNPPETPVNLRGSDVRNIFGQGLDIYTIGTVSSTGAYLMNLTAIGKSVLGPIYVTASGSWQGVRVQGGTQAGMLSMSGVVLEGDKEDNPCIGALLRIDSGNVSLRDSSVDDGMGSPSGTASANGGTASRGLIEIGSTAQVSIDAVAFAHGTNVATTTPVIYNSSPKLYVRGLQTFQRGAAWGSQLPVIAGVAPASANDGSWVQG